MREGVLQHIHLQFLPPWNPQHNLGGVCRSSSPIYQLLLEINNQRTGRSAWIFTTAVNLPQSPLATVKACMAPDLPGSLWGRRVDWVSGGSFLPQERLGQLKTKLTRIQSIDYFKNPLNVTKLSFVPSFCRHFIASRSFLPNTN